MSKIPKISEAEWEVMKVVWEQGPITANEVVDALHFTQWQPKTIKTLLSRLLAKRALGFEMQGRAYRYYALVDRASSSRAESRSFLRRVYDGALAPMLAGFIEEEDLSDEEIATLRRALAGKRRKP